MATKKKRPVKQSVSSAAPRSYSELYKGQSSLAESRVEARPATDAEPAAAVEKKVNWAQEYGYVFRDLRHLGIVSVVLLAVMLVIGFFM